VNAIAVSKGPGSITGLRIGMSAAKGFAYANSAQLVGVSKLEALAMRAATRPGEIICPLMDARQGSIYAGLFRAEEISTEQVRLPLLQPIRLQPDYAGPMDAIAGWATELDAITFCGEGALKFAGRLRELLGPKFRLAPSIRNLPSAEEVAYIGAMMIERGEHDDMMLLEPDYLRNSYASGSAK
jgi:tRNA threonylcarbamoyladenosine biosynthesis protein TsaB